MKWDYRVEDIAIRTAEKRLKEFGNEEWEVFGIMGVGNEFLRVFMRKPITTGIPLLGV